MMHCGFQGETWDLGGTDKRLNIVEGVKYLVTIT